MKRILFTTTIFIFSLLGACQKGKTGTTQTACAENPKSQVPAELHGNWMYGNFSLTEYWSQNPADYLGNALQYAIAFSFHANGTYEQYFTSSSVQSGITTYQQSVTKGTVVVNASTGKITTYGCSAHYKRIRNGQVVEERDLSKSELSGPTNYDVGLGTEPNGSKSIYLLLEGTNAPLTFIQKF